MASEPHSVRGACDVSSAPAAGQEDAVLCFVVCGRPLPGHRIRIIDEGGVELPERREGCLQSSAPSTCVGGGDRGRTLPPLVAEQTGWLEAIRLRDATRAELLEHLDETERVPRFG